MLLIIVHRLLQSFIFPPMNVMFITLIGMIISHWYKKRGRYIIICGLILLYVQSIPWTAQYLNKSLQTSPLNIEQIKNSQAIVVLGGGVNANAYEYENKVIPSNDTLMRLNYVAYLARIDPQKTIITSGGYTGSKAEAIVMRDTLINSYGITNPIITESKSRNTDENAKFVAKILLPLDIHSIILVTQDFHMRRAMMLFKHYGLNPTAAPTDFYYSIDADTPILTFIPNAVAMAQVTLALHEIVGYWVYANRTSALE